MGIGQWNLGGVCLLSAIRSLPQMFCDIVNFEKRVSVILKTAKSISCECKSIDNEMVYYES